MQSSNSWSSSGSSARPSSGAGSRSERQNSRADVAEHGLGSERGDVRDRARHDRVGHAAHLVGRELQVRDRGHGYERLP